MPAMMTVAVIRVLNSVSAMMTVAVIRVINSVSAMMTVAVIEVVVPAQGVGGPADVSRTIVALWKILCLVGWTIVGQEDFGEVGVVFR